MRTEQEWLRCADPDAMLAFLRWQSLQFAPTAAPVASLSGRKARLFACACARRVWHLLDEPESRSAIEFGERYADGAGTETELTQALRSSFQINLFKPTPSSDAAFAAHACVYPNGPWVERSCLAAARAEARSVPGERKARRREARVHQAELLHCIMGNPFQRAGIDPAWLTWQEGALIRLAKAAYHERQLPAGKLDPARLAVLADALEEAGCADAALLGHLRGSGSHVRGCHVLDAILGKE